MPQSHAVVTLTGDWNNTLGGQPFVLAESGAEDKIILLGMQSNLHHLAEAEYMLVCGWNFRNVSTSVLSDLFHPYHQVRPDVSHGVCPATQQAAEYVQSYVHDGQRSCTKFRSGSHPVFCTLRF